MPPHCDTKDGPVVNAAQRALHEGNVNIILPWAPEEAEEEIRDAFAKVLATRELGDSAKEVADTWFFENVVRLHRAGEGAAYTGLKPAGLSEGPVIPLAEKALETGDPSELISFLQGAVEEHVRERFHNAISHRDYEEDDVEAAREYVSRMLHFLVSSHKVYVSITSTR